MRILLLATNTEIDPYPVYPLGMSVVAAALEQAGHSVRQMDLLSGGETEAEREKALQEAVRAFKPEAIGISLRNIDNIDSLTPGSHWSLDAVKKKVCLLRSLSNAPILMGGPAVSIMPEQIGAYCGADCAVAGGGERILPELLKKIAKGEPLPSTAAAHNSLAGREMISPAFEPDILAYYARQSGVVGLQTKRGCPKHCLYCSYPQLEGRAIRARDPEAVADDILRLQSLVEFQEIFFTDSVFNDAEGHWVRLAETLLRRKVRVTWTAFFQPEGLEREKLALCKAAGLKAVELGTDACSDATLKALGKGFTFQTAHEATAVCNELRLPCAHFVIVGGPGETPATLREGLDNLARLPNCLVFPYLGIRILPSTPMQRYAIREGMLSPQADCLKPVYYFSPHIERQEAHEMLLRSFKKNRQRMYPPSVGGEKMKALRALGYRGILWDTLVRYPEA